jgi:hypothetical protein
MGSGTLADNGAVKKGRMGWWKDRKVSRCKAAGRLRGVLAALHGNAGGGVRRSIHLAFVFALQAAASGELNGVSACEVG